MQTAQLSPELVDAADLLGDRHREQLQIFAHWLAPHTDRIDVKFRGQLQACGFDAKQRRALLCITAGAAARVIAEGNPPLKFIEHVEYNGRRLAKLNLPPSVVLDALKKYEQALENYLSPRRTWSGFANNCTSA